MRPSVAVSLSEGEKVLARYSAWLAEWGWEVVAARCPADLAGHGLLFLGGGGDVAVGLGAYADDTLAGPLLTHVDPARDRLELGLLDAARRLGLPVFGTCRGLQVMNLFLGGTLHADMDAGGLAGAGHQMATSQSVEAADFVHPVTTVEGDTFPVCSDHHQAIAALAPGLEATARSPGGIVEAAQGKDLPWRGVQWHPERMAGGPGREWPGRWLAALAAQAGTGT